MIHLFNYLNVLNKTIDFNKYNASLESSILHELDSEIVGILINKCDNLPDDTIVVEIENVPINIETLKRISGRSIISSENWLNDESLNAFIALLNRNYPSSYMFTTNFYVKYKKEGYDKLRRWTKKINITAFDHLLIPLNPNQNHWSVMVVDLRKKCFYYFDSLTIENQYDMEFKEYVTTVFKDLKQYFISEFKDKFRQNITFNLSQCIIVKTTPQQINYKDCGIFMTRVAELVMSKKRLPLTLDAAYFRRRMLVELYEKRVLSALTQLQAFKCSVLGDHVIIFIENNSVTRMFYKSQGRSGLSAGAKPIFDLFKDIWFESEGFSRVSSGTHTRTIQKYSWSDEFLLSHDYDENLIFFIEKIVKITDCREEEAKDALEDFCDTYSSSSFSNNEVLYSLIKTLCKSNDDPNSWKIAVQLSMCSEKPLFFHTMLGKLFWKMQNKRMHYITVENRNGDLLDSNKDSLDNSHLLLDNNILLNDSEPFVSNSIELTN